MTEQQDIVRMIEALSPRIPGVIDSTARRALVEIPEYHVLSEQELAEGIARDLALAIAALVEDRSFTEADRAQMSLIGNARAEQGLPLEGMLRVYRITVDEIFCGLWEAVAADELDAEEVVRLTRRIWAYAGPLMDLATQAYRTRELEEAVADTQRRTALVHELLLSPSASPHAVAAALGLDPLGAYVTFRARGINAASELQLPGVLDQGIVAPYEGDIIGFAKRRPALVPGPELTIGVGPAAQLGGLPGSFVVATRTLDTATAFQLSGVHTLDQLPVHAVAFAEVELGQALHARCVGPVLDSRAGGSEVLDTVRAFLAHELSADATADALEVHPNTVRNRLHRYEALTGVSLRALDDLFQVRIALLHAQLGSSR